MTAPRLLNEDETAHYLGISKSAFSRNIELLEKNNFPRRHPVLKKRDRHTIDLWLDRTYGILDETEPGPVDVHPKKPDLALFCCKSGSFS